MELRLKLLTGKSAGQEIRISSPVFKIGRADECDLRPKSESISRRHCELTVEEGTANVRDLTSRTGTYVNGSKIPAERKVELQTGDTLKVGPLEFGVVIKHGLHGKKLPKVESVEQAAVRSAERRAAADDDFDVSRWLQEGDGRPAAGDTLEAEPGQTLISAADIVNGSQSSGADDVNQAEPKVDPRQAAAEALRKHLRRG